MSEIDKDVLKALIEMVNGHLPGYRDDCVLVTEDGTYTRINGVEKFVPWEDGEEPSGP